MRGQPQVGLRCFIWTTASMSSLVGPLGPGPPLRWEEKDRGERAGDNWFERLADDAAPSGGGAQPIAELALEAVLDGSHPEDLDVAEHRVGCHVGHAPVEVRPGVRSEERR